MLTAWRLVRAAHVRIAFAGEGSRIYPGRWNSRGKAVIYLSEHESLAALETLAHIDPLLFAAERFFSFRVEWDEKLTEYFPLKNLPSGWNMEPPSFASRTIGDEWIEQRHSVALAVPSLLSTSELNFLLNPNHPDFKRVKIGRPIEYRFDPRLIGR